MKSRRTKWIDRLMGLRRPGHTAGHARQVVQRMKPLHARSHKAARLRRARRDANNAENAHARHVRSVAREGDDGMRCWDCKHIPLHPWEIRMGGMG